MINYPEKFLLKDKVVFITGGSGLLGTQISWAVSMAFAKTVILDIDDVKGNKLANEIQNAGFQAHYEHFDILDLEASGEKIRELAQIHGSIDVWINNAYPRTKDWGNKVEDLKLESWRENVDMHLNSYSWLTKEAALVMKERTISGSIINFGSIYGVVGIDPSVYEGTSMTCPMGYAAIKGGIINLTRYLASYFGQNNIRINCVCPGGIFDNQNEIFVKNYEKRVPLKRMGKPEEIASTVLFLASDASSYITGTTMMVDGGWTAI